jgi:putative heme-binding domain-containing protein
VASSDDADPANRVSAVQLLCQSEFETAAPVLKSLLSAAEPTLIQVAAVRGLASFSQPSLDDALLASYRNLGPEAQQALTEAFSRGDRMPHLLTALEQGVISFTALPLAHRSLLLRSSNQEWKSRALALAARQKTSPRAEVIQRLADALPLLEAHAERGAAVFGRECSACHRLEQHGTDLGPRLETVQHRSVGELLIAILDPSREVSAEYVEYAVVLKDGTIATGVIAAESPAAITLKKAGAVEQLIPRRDIEEIFAAGKSVMPEGLEQKLTPQELADLIAYLRRPHELQ